MATIAAPFLDFFRQQTIRPTTHPNCLHLQRKSRDINSLCLTSARTPDLVIIICLLVRLTTSLTPAKSLMHTAHLTQSLSRIVYPASTPWPYFLRLLKRFTHAVTSILAKLTSLDTEPDLRTIDFAQEAIRVISGLESSGALPPSGLILPDLPR